MLEKLKDIFSKPQEVNNKEISDIVDSIYNALGESKNIKNLDACITRVRVKVNDVKQVDQKQLTDLGIKAVIQVQDGVQLVIGADASILKDELQKRMGK